MRGEPPKIYIPTYGRTGRQVTWSMFPQDWQEETVLVCRPEEARALLTLGARVLVCPERGIAPTRQWILDQHEGRRLLMFDDDLKFAARREDDPTKFMKLLPQDHRIGHMLDALWEALDDFPVVGLANRGGANRNISLWRFNERVFDVMGLRLDILREHGIRYRLPFMEDFDITLQVLAQGYSSAMLNTFTKDDAGGSNADGGCSTYRTGTGQAAAAVDLSLLWPEVVSLREVKAEWVGMGSRTDVTVQWKKANAHGVAAHGDRSPIPARYIGEAGLL